MSYKLVAFWGSRKESAEICASRMARVLEAFAAIHPALSHWNKKAMTRKGANAPFCAMPPRTDELAKIFEKGRHYTDTRPRRVIEELGYSISAWNGHDNDYGVGLSVHPSRYEATGSEPNRVSIEMGAALPGKI